MSGPSEKRSSVRSSERYSARSSERSCCADKEIDSRPETVDKDSRPETVDKDSRQKTASVGSACSSQITSCMHRRLSDARDMHACKIIERKA